MIPPSMLLWLVTAMGRLPLKPPSLLRVSLDDPLSGVLVWCLSYILFRALKVLKYQKIDNRTVIGGHLFSLHNGST